MDSAGPLRLWSSSENGTSGARNVTSDRPGKRAKDAAEGKNLLARLHSPPVMLALVFVLLIYLLYILADVFGIEGEGGWIGEILAATLFIAGIIVLAAVLVIGVLALRRRLAQKHGVDWDDKD